ncbi:hypothetical protein BsWGS_02482 [Bradybaena similaris]
MYLHILQSPTAFINLCTDNVSCHGNRYTNASLNAFLYSFHIFSPVVTTIVVTTTVVTTPAVTTPVITTAPVTTMFQLFSSHICILLKLFRSSLVFFTGKL